MYLLSEIELPKGKDPVEFVEFMRDEYVPAVFKGSTRIGQVSGLQLLQRADDPHQFLWVVDWQGHEHDRAGGSVEDEASAKFDEFGATKKPHVHWDDVASWRPEEADAD